MNGMLYRVFCLFTGLCVASWASNTMIGPSNFVPGEISVGQESPLLPDMGGKLLSSPVTTLQSGQIYLRYKNDAQTYSWFHSAPRPQAFNGLKAFKPLGAPPDSFVHVKFYATRNTKSFQDEAEIYFDHNLIYSTRVNTLYYVVNDQWVELKSSPLLMGSLEITSTPVASIFLDGDSLGLSPVQVATLAGIHSVKLEAPGFLPVVSGALVSSTQPVQKTIILMPLDSGHFQIQNSVGMDTLLGVKTLPELEVMWDKLQSEKVRYDQYAAEQRQAFEASYPGLLEAPMGVEVGDLGYERYRDNWQQTRDEAYGLFLSASLAGGKELEEMLATAQKKKDSLESLTITERVRVDAMRSAPGSPGTTSLQFKLSSANGRIDVGWQGTMKDSLIMVDSVLASLRDTMGWWHLEVVYQNKPLRMQVGAVNLIRQYRYQSLLLVGANASYPLEGVFTLPSYLLNHPEVRSWLGLSPETTPASVLDSATSAPDSVPPKNDHEEWMNLLRGEVAEIDGGTFFYKGKMVQMSPFAIDKTEVTQEHYQRIMLSNPAQRRKGKLIGPHKPVINVTWTEADAFCHEIGGTLPTEAQWEFAARAGAKEGTPWTTATIKKSPTDWAIYEANSEDKGEKNTAFGPQDVAGREPNAWGLYDCSGNVSEWTNDRDSWFHFFVDAKDPQGAWMGSDRVFKGGSWRSDLESLDLTAKDYEDPRYWGDDMGFRCVFPSHQVRSLDSLKIYLQKKEAQAVRSSQTQGIDSVKTPNKTPSKTQAVAP
ncbi:MAG TPA: SUMF1/EgtB/PvdO family nonheme iron enzyme [Fibrobacteraceae bacterium]|nr:SUMF1/EgtB/PvdO family nonheme iron enzyme [Fibrobacteraceae bacterium]